MKPVTSYPLMHGKLGPAFAYGLHCYCFPTSWVSSERSLGTGVVAQAVFLRIWSLLCQIKLELIQRVKTTHPPSEQGQVSAQ